MRILIIPTTDWLGHPYPFRLRHIFEKMTHRHEIHVLRFAFYPEKKHDTKTIVHNMNEVKINSLAQYYVLNSVKHYRTIKRIIKENRIEIVINSNLLASYLGSKAINKKARNIFDLSDHFPTSATGYYFNLNSRLGRFSTYCLEKLLIKNLASSDYIVVCSNALKEYVSRLGFASNVTNVPNGVDEFFFDGNHNGEKIRKKFGLNGYTTIGYLGSVEFWLDLLPLLEAVKKLDKYNLKLFIVGSKLRTKTTEYVQSKIKSLGIEKNVVWLKNFVRYEEVPDYLSAMDLSLVPFNTVHPTAYYSAPIRILESLALEIPVISTPFPEAITTGKDYITIVSSTQDYIRTIIQYMKDPTIFIEKTKKGKELLARRLTWNRLAESYEKLLEIQNEK